MHKCTLILCVITHLQRFSDDEMCANGTRTAAPPHGCMREPSHGATVRGQFAFISLSEKRCKCCYTQYKCTCVHNVRINNIPKQCVQLLYTNNLNS